MTWNIKKCYYCLQLHYIKTLSYFEIFKTIFIFIFLPKCLLFFFSIVSTKFVVDYSLIKMKLFIIITFNLHQQKKATKNGYLLKCIKHIISYRFRQEVNGIVVFITLIQKYKVASDRLVATFGNWLPRVIFKSFLSIFSFHFYINVL